MLEDNPEIVFRLKCRKYVEMIRRCSELQNPSSVSTTNPNRFHKNSAASNGHHTDVFDEDMELDEDDSDPENDDDDDSFQMANTTNEHDLGEATEEEDEEEEDEEGEAGEDYEEIPPHRDLAKYDELLQEAMCYGQMLMREYRDEKREYKKTLEDIFSLIAYDDAKASVHGHLLETGRRVQVAEELNSAILGNYESPLPQPASQAG